MSIYVYNYWEYRISMYICTVTILQSGILYIYYYLIKSLYIVLQCKVIHFENVVNFPIVTLIMHLWIQIALREQNPITAMYSLTSAISLCTIHFIFFLFFAFPSLSSPNLQDKEFTLLSQRLLIRPGSQILILAWVKTLSPLRSGDSSFSLVARRRQ